MMITSLMKNCFVLCVTIFLLSTPAFSQSIEHRGQVSGWLTVNGDQVERSQIGARFIPELSLHKELSNKVSFNTELSVNGYGTVQFNGWDKLNNRSKIKPYRLWLRLATTQFEARLGLQKINFGAASLLRPLMWFDRIDPRDPLQLTDGVYALIFRYYFLNNTNIWLWGLYGNKDLKGWEIIPSDREKLEIGGRFQFPLLNGEMAFTFHQRQIDLSKGIMGQNPVGNESIPENRFAIDGKWDIGIGLWFESALIHHDIDLPQMRYQALINLGMDYTFGIGNGLHGLFEHFLYKHSEKIFGAGEKISFSALSLNYPMDLLDVIRGMIYYDWKNKNWYRFVSWNRTYDRWQIFLMGFWNPKQFQIYQNQQGGNLFAGKGVQVMVVLNY